MAIIVLMTPKVTINSVDLTNHCTSVTIDETWADIDATAFGVGAKQHVAGLGDHKFMIELQQDFASSSVEQTIYPLVGQLVAFNVMANNTSTSTTNPAYSGMVLITSWKPIEGKVGTLMTTAATWPISGNVTKSTS